MDNKNFNDVCNKIIEDGVIITLNQNYTLDKKHVYNYRVVCYNKIWTITKIEETYVYINVERG